ncbi:MAG: TraM recognition domain-containing protein [Gammaproteobacteria bacterium]
MIRGLETRHEQNPQKLLRDTRTMGMRIVDFFKNPIAIAVTLVSLGIGCVFFPGLSDLFVLSALGMFFYTYTRKHTLPFRLPRRSNMPDHNDPKPGSGKPYKARGISFFGNDRVTNEELWFNNDDMRTHVLIFGSTGSGKTEALVSLAFNALIQSSGFIYVDGKGDNSLFAKVFSMARYMGREDDILLVNFMTGARDIVGPQERRISNTMNPFANGSSSMLTQLIVSLMDSSSASADGDMWKGRAISFVEALMKVLVYMRDQGHILLDANIIRNYFSLDRLQSIMDKQFPRDNQESVSLENVPEVVLQPIRNYVINLPGYDKSKGSKQVSQVLEQHGFITMQLTRVFSSLADTYGHIIRTNLAEVDFKDIVLNRRILVVLLPALEKSPDELAALGKIIIATLKGMMAAGLGEQVEGTYREMILRKPTNAPTPYMCILDEYGYYAVPGFAVVPAQARSLGFSAVFAGQDLPAFQKASKEEAASIGANTNIKICMKLEDPVETWDFFSKTAGEAYVTKVDAFQTRAESVMNQYLDTRSASTEKRARIDLLDLKDQREGESHIFFKSKVIRARMFYANPEPVKKMHLNQMLKVDKPQSRILHDLLQRLTRFEKIVETKAYLTVPKLAENAEVDLAMKFLNEKNDADLIESSVAALIAYHDHTKPKHLEEKVEELAETELNLFTKMRLIPFTQAVLITDNLEKFCEPILIRNDVRSSVDVIEILTGNTQTQSTKIASEKINEMTNATHYPPIIINRLGSLEVLQKHEELNTRMRAARAEAG